MKLQIALAIFAAAVVFLAQPAFAAGAADATRNMTPAPVPPILDATALKDGDGGRASVDPCTNFYEFSCGAWLDQTTIPGDKTGVSRQVTVASDNTDLILHNILADYARGDFENHSSAERQLANVYESCLDVDKQTPRSLKFVKNEIALIRKAKTPKQLGEITAKLDLFGVSAFFGLGPMQDFSDSTRVIADIPQGGLSFDSRDYYFNQDAKSVEIRQKFVDHVANVFRLLGQSPSQASVIGASVLKFETAMAKGAYALEDSYDPLKTNHPMTARDLQRLAPRFDFKTYFATLSLTSLAKVNVEEPEFISGLNTVLSQASTNDVTNYLIFRFVDSLSPRMGGAFTKEAFDFWQKFMSGAKQPQAQWQLCTNLVKNSMGYALAEAYLKTFDGRDIKRRTEAMISNIKQTFVDDLQELNQSPDAWIDDATLKGADEKVAAIAQKVGSPDKFRDYSSVKTTPANVLENALRLNTFETRRSLAKIGRPVDKSEWEMMPWEINAYYDRSNNQFVFPFGILMPPSLDFTASDGANYGAFGGGTIGHELTHGFDNNGQKYDAKGNLRNWWTPATNTKFTEKAQCYIDQANAYDVAQVHMKVAGAQTLEENLADQGGVKLGYKALDKILSTRPEGAKWQGRYTERQQYWIGYAQSWCTKSTDESLRLRLATDAHPPAEFRVNGVMMNRPEFARDFNCPAGAPMAPANRCALW
jgi:putative endopeptidase